ITTVPHIFYEQSAKPYIVHRVGVSTPENDAEDFSIRIYDVFIRVVIGHLTANYEGENEKLVDEIIPLLEDYLLKHPMLTTDTGVFTTEPTWMHPDGFEIGDTTGVIPFDIGGIGSVQVGEELGLKLIYGDTDSVFFALLFKYLTRKALEKLCDLLVEKMNESFDEYFERLGVPEDQRGIEMELQGIYSPLGLRKTKKAYYAGLIYDGKNWYDKPQLYIKGHPMVKASTCEFIKFSQAGTYNILIKNDNNYDRLFKYYKKQKKLLMSGKLDQHLILSSSTKELIENYDQDRILPPHVRAAKKLKSDGLFTFGERIYYVITNVKNGAIEVQPVRDGKISTINRSAYRYYWDNYFWNYIKNDLM
ncbi:hypothetical protein LCGC14_3017510, partial [marine sediment metagenome]